MKKILFFLIITHVSVVACKPRPTGASFKDTAGSSTIDPQVDPLVDPKYAAWLDTFAPRADKVGALPFCPADCAQVDVYVELPRGPKDSNVGHTAISFGERFYDFGPANHTGGPVLGGKGNCADTYTVTCPGSRWWANRYRQVESNGQYRFLFGDQVVRHEDIKTSQVLNAVPSLAGPWPVIAIPLCLKPSAAQMAEEWWQRFEKDRPAYQIPGAQCTSAVYASLVAADIYSDASLRSQKAGVIGTFQGGITSPTKFSRSIMEKPASIFDERMLCGGQGFPLKARRIY